MIAVCAAAVTRLLESPCCVRSYSLFCAVIILLSSSCRKRCHAEYPRKNNMAFIEGHASVGSNKESPGGGAAATGTPNNNSIILGNKRSTRGSSYDELLCEYFLKAICVQVAVISN